ncbi:glycine dehydrogenase-like protein [Clohesyomyces aquaticus]|uniref:Glycine cleavage system P protein n=1 Tax=Clohesyomyces aquaticus TaxID=1231657 RepID=A0A1Y1ZVG9_9PLEO|nr:glycine dehydrogenase-like protein [Clohesyomyces aquaticus]
MHSTWLRAASAAGRHVRSARAAQLPYSSLSRPRHGIAASRQALPLLSGRHFQSTTAADYFPGARATDSYPLDTFPRRHIGPSADSVERMLETLDPPAQTLDQFVKQVVPPNILSSKKLQIHRISNHPPEFRDNGVPESTLSTYITNLMRENKSCVNFIGCGYFGTHVPQVIKRNVLENPAWYTSYTPYQPEISQGRLESLLNFQTMVSDLTSLPIANASVLDEPTAAAEAMTLALGSLPLSRQRGTKKTYLVSSLCHPQTIEVLYSRAEGFGITIEVGNVLENDCKRVEELGDDLVGVLVQYPNTEGGVEDFSTLSEKVHNHGASLAVATDLLALTQLTPPGEFGADVAFGSAQRFGVPMGFGGPHAAFFACTEQYKRKIPGRLIGLSKDRLGDPAARLALQTREQHIRREKATSNICTAQALLANMSAFYAIYHGPKGLAAIAKKVILTARHIQRSLVSLGYQTGQRGHLSNAPVAFDTVVVETGDKLEAILMSLKDLQVNVRQFDHTHLGITVDETTTGKDVGALLSAFEQAVGKPPLMDEKSDQSAPFEQSLQIPAPFQRTSPFLTHPVFNSHHSETELLRYIHHLQSKDLSLVHSMIPLGSCTMKLNATSEMAPISLDGVANMHPFAPPQTAQGYATLIEQLEKDLANITGFHSVSLQPNSGAQGEFAGLRVIRKFQQQKKQPSEKKRDICLIPVSAHGTNPASAAMAGMRVVPIKCDPITGNLDMKDLEAKCEKHGEELSAIMITYPSTFGVFEPKIKEVCELVHRQGAQVYMDGANMNAQIGLCSPGEIGADVCHLNLHKTFCIPHGGGGPGVGPIGVKEHLAPFLPGHKFADVGGKEAIAPISGAPWGSASLLPITWAYIKMMGSIGLTQATKVALLNANYILSRLKPHYPILYTNENGRCAHEFILDVRKFKETAGIQAIDVAKRLQDYGFHAPTMSWPVANTLMIEPTESEGKEELDRFCDALISIRKEIEAVEKGAQPREGNVLKMAPHSQKDLIIGEWDRPYSREKAAYPLPYLKEKKFWPSVTRLDDAYGDSNLFCTCAPVDAGGSDDLTGMEAPSAT